MRVIFIGRCHAPAMRLAFARFGRAPIASGLIDIAQRAPNDEPIDFSEATAFDHAVYFPCDFGDDRYQTALMSCLRGTRTHLHIVAPLRFLGHHPGLEQCVWYSWSYRRFYEERAKFLNFEDFAQWAMWEAFTRAEALEGREEALDRLRVYEDSSDCVGAITRFVTTHDLYRSLFPYPTHPSNFVYAHVARELSKVLGIPAPEGLELFAEEIHPDAHIPALPSVARDLGLRFNAEHYRLDFVMGERSFPMLEWLKMLYFSAPDTQMLTPGWGGLLSCANRDIEVVRQQAIFARKDGGGSYVALSVPEALREALPIGSTFELLGNNWDKRELGGFTYAA